MVDPFWGNNFEDIYCITIRSNKERQAAAKEIANALGIPLQFYYVDKHPRGGTYGCMHSHLSLTKMLYEKGSKHVLIFEDDFVPSPGYNETIMHEVADFMKTNLDWELLQLGYSPLRSHYDMRWPLTFTNATKANDNGTIIKHTGLALHAYCLSRKGMKYIIDELSHDALSQDNDKLHIDVLYCEKIKHGYCTVPIMFDQRWCLPSNNNAYTFIENVFYRPMQCSAEKYLLFYRLSYLPRYRFAVNLVILALVTLTALFIYHTIYRRNMFLQSKRQAIPKTRR